MIWSQLTASRAGITITKTFVRILPAVGSLCAVLVSFFYLFTMLGIEWYGVGDRITDKLDRDNPLLANTPWLTNAAVLGYHNVVDGLYTTFQVGPLGVQLPTAGVVWRVLLLLRR